jgi:hypothetical protein
MKASNVEIAGVALCSEGAVRKARERHDFDDLGVLVGWVLAARFKALGVCGVDELVSRKEVNGIVVEMKRDMDAVLSDGVQVVPCGDDGYMGEF